MECIIISSTAHGNLKASPDLRLNSHMSSTWSTGIGKFKKKEPKGKEHGWLWKKIKNWRPIKFINFCGPSK